MTTQQLQTQPIELLICPNEAECDETKLYKLRRAIEKLGGVEQEEGFLFSTPKERSLAADILRDQFGSRYFYLS